MTTEKQLELAWQIIGHWKKEYASEAEAIAELGNLDALAIEMTDVIDQLQLMPNDDIVYAANQVEMVMF